MLARLFTPKRGLAALGLVAAIALVAITWLSLDAAFAQDPDGRWGWDDKKDGTQPDYTRPKPRSPGKKILILRARGGDLSAVLTDGLATNPEITRNYTVLRLDSDTGADNADYVLAISGVLLPREVVGTNGGSLVVVLTLLHPVTGEVLNGDRHVYADLAAAFKDLGDLDEHMKELTVRRRPWGDRPPVDPTPSGPPSWASNPTKYDGFLSTATANMGARDANSGYAQAEVDARHQIHQIVSTAARVCVLRYYLRRNQRVNAQDEASENSLAGFEVTRRDANRNGMAFDCYLEARVPISSTRSLFESIASRIARRIFRDAALDSREIQAFYSAYLKENGWAVTDAVAEPEPAPEPACKVTERRDLGAGWALVTCEATADDVAAATALAKDFVMFNECPENIQKRWENVRGHQQFNGALGSWATATILKSEQLTGKVKVTFQLRVASRAFSDWAARVAGN
ncbi:MAG: hypothetical protein AB7S36_06540 [Planctomycetota bacterium]